MVQKRAKWLRFRNRIGLVKRDLRQMSMAISNAFKMKRKEAKGYDSVWHHFLSFIGLLVLFSAMMGVGAYFVQYPERKDYHNIFRLFLNILGVKYGPDDVQEYVEFFGETLIIISILSLLSLSMKIIKKLLKD